MCKQIGDNTEIAGTLEIRKEGGGIFVGNDCLIEGYVVCENQVSKIVIGDNVYIGGSTVIDCAKSITIEDDVLISYHVTIADNDGHSVQFSARKNDLQAFRQGKIDWSAIPTMSILIKRGAWIGARCIILKGVTIGEGAVVGADSVVTRNVPAWHIVAGNPARIIRKIEEIER
jgi:acetyltransferase-like isoleucine patch superfamily enzyme